jgi:hypothetical protein
MASIKSLITEKQRIIEAKNKIKAREKKLTLRLIKLGDGHYVVDGELWEIKIEYWRSLPESAHLICKGELL